MSVLDDGLPDFIDGERDEAADGALHIILASCGLEEDGCSKKGSVECAECPFRESLAMIGLTV